MKTNPRADEDLTKLLRTWRVESHDDPTLSVKVWNRIGDSPGEAVPGRLGNLIGWVLRPVGMVTIVSAFILMGAALGEVSFSRGRDAAVERLAAQYVRSIDPILMTGHQPVSGNE
jgi:hypothetical protein